MARQADIRDLALTLRELLSGGDTVAEVAGELRAADVISPKDAAGELAEISRRNLNPALMAMSKKPIKGTPAEQVLNNLQSAITKLHGLELELKGSFMPDHIGLASELEGLGADWPKYLAQRLIHDSNPLAQKLGRELALMSD